MRRRRAANAPNNPTASNPSDAGSGTQLTVRENDVTLKPNFVWILSTS